MIKFENKSFQNSTGILKEIGEYVYNLNDVIGTGEFSSVYKGLNQNTNEIVAIKIIDRKSIQNNQIFRNLLVNEINILKSVDNKCLLKLYKYLETINDIYIVTEYVLMVIYNLQQKKKDIYQNIMQQRFQSILLKPYFIQRKEILSIEILRHKIFQFQIKYLNQQILDLQLIQIHVIQKVLQIGTPLYMAPEIYSYYQYSSKTDLWALGIVFYEMLFGKVPFNAKNPKVLELMFQLHRRSQTIQFDNRPQKITDAAQDFINSILVIDPKQRFDISQAAQAANHPLIQSTFYFSTRSTSTCEQIKLMYLLIIINQIIIKAIQKTKNFLLLFLIKFQSFQFISIQQNKIEKIKNILYYEFIKQQGFLLIINIISKSTQYDYLYLLSNFILNLSIGIVIIIIKVQNLLMFQKQFQDQKIE
ncbi:unnamed protein product [Paramecium sonneborni]|uniref:Protein kinase domain-containing protein n=1 Tax=Paramecium sonneborni TaxID=65129 RepID=A0A8S1P9J0_9CILI|nr:unnamed protein product [Paramecium sonneborni]